MRQLSLNMLQNFVTMKAFVDKKILVEKLRGAIYK
jgi:hypothetical protein